MGVIGPLIGGAPVAGDWILLSLGGVAAEELVTKLLEANPKARIVLVSNSVPKVRVRLFRSKASKTSHSPRWMRSYLRES
jgi:hypothetical protein